METTMRTMEVRSAVLIGATIFGAACSDAANTVTEPGQPNAGALNPVAFDQTVKTKHGIQIVTATGDITGAVGEYRALLGGQNNLVTPGELETGHREINWDGVPAAITNNDLFPGNFFSARGAVFSTDGTGFQISDTGYVNVNPHYAGEFIAFSPKKLFVARGSTIITVRFFVAGTTKPAVVTGFGSVFEDVGRANRTTIEYFDAAGNLLRKIAAPRRSDAGGQSFAGAVFDSPIVASVRITAGDTPVGADTFDNVKGAGKKHDIVATDDFLYGEPHEIK
jgi:hypothetical protein